MKLLRKWFDRLRPKSQGEIALQEIMHSAPGTIEAIHLEEVGLPNGRVTTIQWLYSQTSAKLRISHRTTRSAIPQWTVSERDEAEFESLIAAIRELDSPKIENFTAPVRDGVVYFIAWGNAMNVRSVLLRNPIAGSDQQSLVTLIRSSVGNDRIEIAGQ